MIKNFLLSIFLLLIPSCFWGNTVYRPQVSVAGFIPLSGSGRDIVAIIKALFGIGNGL